MKLNDSRYEEIKQIIIDLFISLDINCTPISGFEIATKLGIKVMPYSSISTKKQSLLFQISQDGFSYMNPFGSWYIYYNDCMGYGRINNTIMHDGKMYVVDGHHRLQAAKILGIENVPTTEVFLPYKGYKTINDLLWFE